MSDVMLILAILAISILVLKTVFKVAGRLVKSFILLVVFALLSLVLLG